MLRLSRLSRSAGALACRAAKFPIRPFSAAIPDGEETEVYNPKEDEFVPPVREYATPKMARYADFRSDTGEEAKGGRGEGQGRARLRVPVAKLRRKGRQWQ